MGNEHETYRPAVSDCPLCTGIAPILGESVAWRLVLNRNQNLLGKCMLVLRRHTEAVVDLTPFEWDDLHGSIRGATWMLIRAFRPDHFNYAFLQNQDRHVHLHIIPRYAGTRTFSGLVFTDLDFPGHYRVPSPANQIGPEQLASLAGHLQAIMVDLSD